MPTLHKATEETKLVLKWGGILLAVFLFGMFLMNSGKSIKNSLFPPPPTPPTVTFGKLPHLLFPENKFTKPLSFQINTVSGTLPAFPDRINVYETVTPAPNLLALQRAEKKVASVGFNGPNTQLGTTTYNWTNPISPYQKLTLEILTYNFSLSSAYLSDPSMLNPKKIQREEDAKSTVENFLSSLSGIPNDIDSNKTHANSLSVENGILVKATSLAATQFVRVDFFQKDIDEIPIYYSNPPTSSMNFIVGENKLELKEVVEANFFHQEISSSSATYPIISAQEALEYLKKGKGYITHEPSNATFSVKNVFLAYYLGDTPQKYLIPIIVFESDGIYAYVHAVREEWFLNE